MRIVLQRVRQAEVEVDSELIAAIGSGLVLLLGFGGQDCKDLPGSDNWNACINKLPKLRIFPDEKNRSNLSLEQVAGEILVVSQFTLYAEWRKGRRPCYTAAAEPDLARYLYESFLRDINVVYPEKVKQGRFGAEMNVKLTNWGPVTLFWDTEQH